MKSASRREFLSLWPCSLAASRRLEPERILYNGKFITMDPGQPAAEAVAIARSRFLAVGSNREVRPLAESRTELVDLAGKTVVPGFIDAHTHPAYAGMRHLRWVDCDLPSIVAIQEALRLRAARTPPGRWVVGFKYDDTKTRELRRLTREDLDAVSANHPVLVEHRGGHTAYVNSVALRIAGVTEDAPDPDGGRFDRDPAGRLTGRLEERAKDVVQQHVSFHFSRTERREAVRRIAQMMARAGITSVHDAEATPEDLQAYQDAREASELSFRVYCMIQFRFLEQMIAAGVRTGLGDEWVRVGGIKLVADGSISERTARVSEPYVGRPNDYGILVTSEEELYAQARKAHLAGWQIGTHANGDVAIDMVLRVYERLQREAARRDPRFRIEHCTVVTPELVRRILALGAIPNPFSTYVYYHGEKMREYGPERLNRMFAVRSFLDAGIPVTQTSDYPAGPFEPMMAIQSSVSRTDSRGQVWGPAQRITVEEALRVGTIHGAYASFEEHLKGSLEPGKLADLVVLGEDPRDVPPSSLLKIPVERTMVGGRWVAG